jgi:hypothetical protein
MCNKVHATERSTAGILKKKKGKKKNEGRGVIERKSTHASKRLGTHLCLSGVANGGG